MARTFTLRQVGLFGTAVLAIGFAFGVRSSSPASPGQFAPESGDPVASPTADDPSDEGITVHGHWKLEIRDPDGTVANVVEFENALTADGALALPRILGRVATVSEWVVSLRDGGGNSPCADGNGQANACFVLEGNGTDSSSEFYNLTSTVPPVQDAQENLLILSGTATAARDGQITIVGTDLTIPCGTGVPPECGVTRSMTQTDVAPVVVQAGQSILATVQISFS